MKKVTSIGVALAYSISFAQGTAPPSVLLQTQVILAVEGFKTHLGGFYQGPTQFYNAGTMKGKMRIEACEIWRPLIVEAKSKQWNYERSMIYVEAAVSSKTASYPTYAKFVVADEALRDAMEATDALNDLMCGAEEPSAEQWKTAAILAHLAKTSSYVALLAIAP